MFHMTKKVTKAGSICIPLSIRREQVIQPGDALDVETAEDGNIIIKPHNPRCVFCTETEQVSIFNGKGICTSCIQKIQKSEVEK